MPDVLIGGRLEGKYHSSGNKLGPLAILLHPHPSFGGTMNHPVLYQTYYALAHAGFSVLRFNFRGVGKSTGTFDHGDGEMADSHDSIDWLWSQHPSASNCLLFGFSFGAWVGSQVMIRRPEITDFVCVSPMPNVYDFSEMAEFCPANTLVVSAEMDAVVPKRSTDDLMFALTQRRRMWIGGEIEHAEIPGANHFFDDRIPELVSALNGYVSKRYPVRPRPK